MTTLAETRDVPASTPAAEAGAAMASIRRWFAVLIVVAALHMTEQLVFGLEELDMIRRVLARYHAMFANPDFGTVLLVTIGMLLVLLLIDGVLLGGRPLRWVMGFFVVLSISEIHHLIESVAQRRYVPGLVTGTVWVGVGVMLARATRRQARMERREVS